MFGAIWWLLVVITLYFLPTIVANNKKHPQISSIFVINLLLGWTFIGWVVALAMAVSAVKVEKKENKIDVP